MENNIIIVDSLNDDQKLAILKHWTESQEPPSIASLIEIAFPNTKNPDPRTKEGKLIKEYLASQSITPPSSEYKKKGLLELTIEQKQFIDNNCSKMKAIEMARVLFNNPNLSPVSQESRSIFAYAKSLNKEKFQSDEEIIPDKDYSPPTTIDRVCAKINKYVKVANLDFRNLKVSEKRLVQSLLTYLHNFRFIYQINSYFNERDRNLFESAFVEYTWDKGDLSSEDIDQYIILCNEKIMASNILKNINQLQEEQERIIQSEGKMSMSHVDALKNARTEYNDCVKRQQNLYKTLTQERSDRLANKHKETPSLLNLIALWKEEETRKEIVRLAEERNVKLGEEIDRLSNMDDLKIRLVGLSKDEILYG